MLQAGFIETLHVDVAEGGKARLCCYLGGNQGNGKRPCLCVTAKCRLWNSLDRSVQM
jgi:hypothetical protein